MGLSSALNSAISGLQVTQAGVEVVSRNIANADTPGYTRKIAQQSAVVVGGEGLGARTEATRRALDVLLQIQFRTAKTNSGRTYTVASMLSRLDALFGVPGGAGALDAAISKLSDALRALVDSPNSLNARAGVITQAGALASRLNALSEGVQDLRQVSEKGIDNAVNDANRLLNQLADINQQIVASPGSDVDLLDQRDQALLELSSLFDIQVQEADTGAVRVLTGSGNLLLDGNTARQLTFDPATRLTAESLYNRDPAQRGVGTVLLENGAGQALDLFASGDIRGGTIGGYRELRDEILVNAQAQLDELAHGLATVAVRGAASTALRLSAGAQQGFDVDVSALLPGDELSIAYTETPPGQTRNVTVVRVDDPSLLPLDNAVTANPTDTVIGIDFSAGPAAAARRAWRPRSDPRSRSPIRAAIPCAFWMTGRPAPSISDRRVPVSPRPERPMRGWGLAVFTDGPSGTPYTGALEDGGQKLGFAARIQVNPAVSADSSTLVTYSTSPPTPAGDQSRPA